MVSVIKGNKQKEVCNLGLPCLFGYLLTQKKILKKSANQIKKVFEDTLVDIGCLLIRCRSVHLQMPMSIIWLTSSSLGWNFSRLKIRLLPSLSSPPRLNERPEHLEADNLGSEIIALWIKPSRRRRGVDRRSWGRSCMTWSRFKPRTAWSRFRPTTRGGTSWAWADHLG